MKSSYNTDFSAKPTPAPTRVTRSKEPSAIAPRADAKIECTSSYKDCYNQKDAGSPAKAFRPPPPQGLGWVNASGTSEPCNQTASVMKDCYRSYDAQEVQQSHRERIIINPEYGTIDLNPDTRPGMSFSTTATKNFVKHTDVVRREPAPGARKIAAQGIAGIAGGTENAKMDLATTHTDAFTGNPATAKQCVGVGGKNVQKPIPVRNCHTTQRDDYIVHKEASRPKSFQPVREYHQPDTKFVADAQYQDSFKPHGNCQRQPMVPAARTRDNEAIIRHVVSKDAVYDTEYDRTYANKDNMAQKEHFERPHAIVPKTTNRTAGTFYDATSYSSNYNCEADRQVQKMPSFRPQKSSKSPFYKESQANCSQFRSTTKDHYNGVSAQPAKICRPKMKREDDSDVVCREACFDTEYTDYFANGREGSE